jgi:hypothetical protein
LTVDLKGRTRSEFLCVVEQLRSIIERFSELRIEFIFDKKDAVYQISGLLDNFIGYENFFYFTKHYAANNRVFIGFGGTEITEFFKDREFLKTFLAMLLMTGKKDIYEKIEPELQRCNWKCFDGYFFHTDGKIIKTKNVDAEKAKRFLLGLGDYTLSDKGVLTSLEVARNGEFYIPQGVTKIAVDFLPEDVYDYSEERKMTFDSDKEIFIGDAGVFKPKKGKKYEVLPITVDLRGKSYGEITAIAGQLWRFGITYNLDVKYIFDKKKLVEQMEAVLIYDGDLWGVGFGTRGVEEKIAVIGRNNVTKFFKDRVAVAGFLNFLKKANSFAFQRISELLDDAEWVYSDGTKFEKSFEEVWDSLQQKFKTVYT